MPVRDGERFLVEAVESVLAQTVSELELIVVDDGSTDATPALLAGSSPDARVRVLTQPPRGLDDGAERRLRAAQAPVIARMDADDVALADRLERQLAVLDAHPDVALLGGGIVLVDEDGREFDRERAPVDARPLRPQRRSSTARSSCAPTPSGRSAATGSTSPRTTTSGSASRSDTASPRSRSRSSATGSIPGSSP